MGGGIAMLMDVGVGTSEHKVIHSFIHSFIGNYGLLRRANPLSKSALLVNVSFFPRGYLVKEA